MEELQQADMELVNREDCNKEYPGMIEVSHVCAKGLHASACFVSR